MTFLCFFSPRPRVTKDVIKTSDITPEVMKEEDWRTKTVKFTLAKIMDTKEQKSNLSSSSSNATSSSTNTTTTPTLAKDETLSSMEVLPLVSMPDYYHELKGQTDNILYFPPCAESSKLSEMAHEITAPKKYTMTFDERIATTMMQGSSNNCAADNMTEEQKLSIHATTMKILSLLNTALRQIMLVDIIPNEGEEDVTVESDGDGGGTGTTTSTTTMDYTPIMTEYVDIVRNVHELSSNTKLLDDDTLNAKVTELVSRAYRLLQMTPRITNETNTVIETLNTMLLDKISEVDDDHDDDYHQNNNNSDVDNNLVDYSAFLSKYIVIANEAEKARVCGNDIRGRELIVQAFQANKTLLA
jgi:hypothetical protein